MADAGKEQSHLFTSRAQWRWAYATHQPWAHDRAERNKVARPFKTLPARTGAPTARTLR